MPWRPCRCTRPASAATRRRSSPPSTTLPRGRPERRQARRPYAHVEVRLRERSDELLLSRSSTTAPASTRRRGRGGSACRTCATGSAPSAATSRSGAAQTAGRSSPASFHCAATARRPRTTSARGRATPASRHADPQPPSSRSADEVRSTRGAASARTLELRRRGAAASVAIVTPVDAGTPRAAVSLDERSRRVPEARLSLSLSLSLSSCRRTSISARVRVECLDRDERLRGVPAFLRDDVPRPSSSSRAAPRKSGWSSTIKHAHVPPVCGARSPRVKHPGRRRAPIRRPGPARQRGRRRLPLRRRARGPAAPARPRGRVARAVARAAARSSAGTCVRTSRAAPASAAIAAASARGQVHARAVAGGSASVASHSSRSAPRACSATAGTAAVSPV